MTLGALRAALVRSGAARRARRQLARDIADYNTPAEQLDLDATLDRYPAEQSAYIRSLLHRAA